jgi:hypothetical protein
MAASTGSGGFGLAPPPYDSYDYQRQQYLSQLGALTRWEDPRLEIKESFEESSDIILLLEDN